ncbi:MAG: alkaline phosphatase [Candidatus Hinthialibacter antarcticus]|nr:alkaline phosphatase [Candidatus Hinthialibacter antarcticus]
MKHLKYSFMIALLAMIALPSSAAPTPKNVIIMIADGMGFLHTEAASLYRYGKTKGQIYWDFDHYAVQTSSLNTKQGYDPNVVYDDFKNLLKDPTDSASSATALSTGVKTLNAMLGMTPDKKHLRHIMEDAEEMGKATGVLTTVYFAHATPAGFIVHIDSRGKYKEVANQMLWDSKTDVIIGAGHPWYNDDGEKVGGYQPDPFSTPLKYDRVGGLASWKKILDGTPGADADGDGEPDAWTLVDSKQDFRALASKKSGLPKRLFGLAPLYSTLQQSRSGNQFLPPYEEALISASPTMTELMAAALNVLNQDEDGFVLMAEGGAVDWASHGNQPGRMIEEQIDFDRAIEYTVAWVEKHSSWDETALLITADHECGYLCGPGSDPTWQPLFSYGAGKMPGMEFHSGGHTNQLVPLFVKGAGTEKYKDKVIGKDPVHGPFIDNTSIPTVVRELWEAK